MFMLKPFFSPTIEPPKTTNSRDDDAPYAPRPCPPPTITVNLLTPFNPTVHLNLPRIPISVQHQLQKPNHCENEKRGKWFTLPPYTPTINGSVLGKALSAKIPAKAASETTALKWVLRCCPELPRNLVQKLFRLRQVRRESSVMESCNLGNQCQEHRLTRVAAKDSMDVGDRIFLPISVKVLPASKQDCHCSEEEINFIRGLELFKDTAIIVINKPPGMPVQGGIGIKRSLDELSASCLSYDYSEPPRLVHRLDRDCSGILVMGRTQTSATFLHAIFREKTLAASNDDVGNKRRILQRKYWALVISSPRHLKGINFSTVGKGSCGQWKI